MTMSDQIIAVLDNLCTKFGIAIDWTSENVLPYIMELTSKLIKYEIATSVVWCLFIAIITFATYKLTKYLYKQMKEYDSPYSAFDWEFAFIGGCVALCFCIFAVVLVIPIQTFDIVECLTFPEKAIFEYVSYMMKTV